MLSSLGLYNWYTNMPEMKVGEYNIGGGGGRTLRGKANFYKKFVDTVVKILPYGQQQPEVKPTKQPKSLYERRQDRLKQRQNRQQLRQKRLDKRRNR